MQIQTILVPTDFSQPSRLGLNHALAFARKFGSRLVLLHVIELPKTLTLPETARAERDQAERMLAALIASEDQTGLSVDLVVKAGNVEEQILAAIPEQNADLIVMGTHARGPVGRLLIGSVTHHIIQSIRIPMMTVAHVRRVPAFNRILFATDFSALSDDGSRYALALAQKSSASLIAVHAVDVGVEGGAEAGVYLTEDRMQEARTHLDEFKAAGSQQRVVIDAVVSEGPAAETILKSAADMSADLIVITIAKSDSMERTPLLPTAERIVRDAHVPVLAIPLVYHEQQEQQPHVA
jgi:nucleotide-binding universal stress UspA family protein